MRSFKDAIRLKVQIMKDVGSSSKKGNSLHTPGSGAKRNSRIKSSKNLNHIKIKTVKNEPDEN